MVVYLEPMLMAYWLDVRREPHSVYCADLLKQRAAVRERLAMLWDERLDGEWDGMAVGLLARRDVEMGQVYVGLLYVGLSPFCAAVYKLMDASVP